MLSKEKGKGSKSERPENSVLFSLKELRQLENERVKVEADARRAREEAERRTKAEAEQRARDEETRRLREEAERRQRIESEREDRQRADRLRVEEAERRARVEGELKLRELQLLEKERQRHLPGRRFGRAAWSAAAAGAALFLAVGGGLAAWTSRQHQAEKNALEREIARRSEEVRAAQLTLDARIHALEEKTHRYLGEAKTTKEQARILGDLQRQKETLEAARPRPPHRTSLPMQPTAPAPRLPFRVPQKTEIDNEPLGGLPGIKSGGF
jgi:colicin import membrane protein